MPDTEDVPILLMIQRGGWTIYYAERPTANGSTAAQRQGYGDENSPGSHGDSVREALALNIPCIDTRTIPDNKIVEYILKGPVVAQGEPDPYTEGKGLEGCGYGSADRAPVSVILGLAKSYGATVRYGA